MTPTVLRGDARALPLADASVDLIVTSPPYFGLRDYGVPGQLGIEASPAAFIAALIDCTHEMVRVLKPSGSIFVNLGDKYAADARGPNGSSSALTNGAQYRVARHESGARRPKYGVPKKSLLLLPERFRIAAVDELGLIARAVICWSKPNGLPESVTDRVRRSHEDWVHLTKSGRYFSAVDELREPHTRVDGPRPLGTRNMTPRHNSAADNTGWKNTEVVAHPLGKLPGSVWEIPTQPLNVPDALGVDHFAAFPMEWPRRLITGWCPRDVCTACGEGRRPQVLRSMAPDAQGRTGPHGGARASAHGPRRTMLNGLSVREIVGYACSCPDTAAVAVPGVVLDPFGGTGTTALVADVLGRRGISVDLSVDYQRIAQWRVADPRERARGAGLDPQQLRSPLPGQLDLFQDSSCPTMHNVSDRPTHRVAHLP